MKKPFVAAIIGGVAVASIGVGSYASAMDKAITLTIDGTSEQVNGQHRAGRPRQARHRTRSPR